MFLTLYLTMQFSLPDQLYFYCFYSFEYVDLFDYYAAYWFTLRLFLGHLLMVQSLSVHESRSYLGPSLLRDLEPIPKIQTPYMV